ncbi:glycine cleavage system protein H [Thermoplasmatales archaeon ex4484_30]|nr:MAG: glycine cleavage system protein GcvH [Thermoplasmata archaeon]OYT61804.1 MAG: glycine cleavage system protein H [Thermoplasmatales archaeon ex4484_30]
MEIRENLLYTETHEWILKKDRVVRIGISDYAQDSLTDIVYVELPQIGQRFKKGEVIVTLESVKSVAEVYAPVSGEIIAVNEKLNDEPGLVNKMPYDDGWLVEMKLDDESELNLLMDAKQYEEMLNKSKDL